MKIIGIDPGIGGAVGVVTERGAYLGVDDMPTMAATKSSDKQKINVPELARILRSIMGEGDGVVIAVMEFVQPMPSQPDPAKPGARRGMGAASAFSFGKSVGHIEACLLTLGISVEFVHQGKWKRDLGLTRDKEGARTFAQSVFPAAELGKKKHHGRAEALLIGRWYSEKLRREAIERRSEGER